mgnify:CR=1 FL=1
MVWSTDGKQSRDVVIKIPRDITGYEKEFAKEAKLLNSVKGHPNIVSFEKSFVSVSPFAIMTEYLKFSFDATNACVFLALKVCDAFISISAQNKLKETPRVATSVIAS